MIILSSGFDGEPTFPASPELLLSAKVIRGTILGHKPLSALIFQTNLHGFTSRSLVWLVIPLSYSVSYELLVSKHVVGQAF